MSESDDYKLPFKEGLGAQIGESFAESRVFEHGDEWVLKATFKDKLNTLERIKSNKADYEYFKRWFGERVPESQFLQIEGADGKPVNAIRQRRVNGTPLIKLLPEVI